MTFANPLMLWGTLAAMIPLLVHLFDRRRPRPHPFGALAFVLRSQRRTASRLKLKRLLLYILRTLVLLALPIALARPEWQKDRTAAVNARGPAATALVLDTSLSMRWTEGGKGSSLFERGRDLARDSLKELFAEEPATVLLCGNEPQPPESPSFDRGRMRSLLDDAQVTYGASDLTRCLQLAAHALEENPLPAKRLVLISDLAANGFHLEAPAPEVQLATGERVRPELVIRDVAEGQETLGNRAIVDLKIEPALQVGPRAFQFTFTVRNFSPEPAKDLEASLKVGDQVVAKGFLDVPAQGTAQKSLVHRFEGGGVVEGEIALEPDSLAEDDRRAFVVAVPRELEALVVNGAPHSVRYRDEAFFVEAALTAPGSPVRPSVRDPEAGLHEDFSKYDVVLLLNVTAPTAEQAQRLSEFVSNGGGLFISMGDQIDPDAYNQRLGSVLPRALRLPKTSANPTDADADDKAAKLLSVSTDHAVFSIFLGRAREGLMSSRFFRYMLLEPESGTATRSEVLAAFEDGAPAIATARIGKGRVLLYTSSVDRDWGDFAIRTSFLPLMQRFTAYLAGSLEEREELKARVGDTLILKPDPREGISAVRGPAGEDVAIQLQADESVAVGPLAEPGVHQVFNEKGERVPRLTFPALLDSSESDLTRIKPEVLTGYFGEASVKTAGLSDSQSRVPLWTWLFVAAAIALFLEGVLLRK